MVDGRKGFGNHYYYEQEYTPGVGDIVQKVVVGLAGSITVFFMCMGMYAYAKSNKRVTMAIPIMRAYSLVIIGMCVFDYTPKLIWVFFALIMVANFLTMCGLVEILRNVPTTEGETLRKNSTIYLYVMMGVYAVVILLSIIWMKPNCEDQMYPFIFTCAGALFLINVAYQSYMHFTGYGL